MPPNNVSGSDGLCAASLGDSHSTPLCSTALSSHASAPALLVEPAPKHTTLARPVVSRAATKESMRSDPESDEHCVVLLNESFLGNKAELHSLRHSLSLNVSWSVASQAESATIFNLIGLKRDNIHYAIPGGHAGRGDTGARALAYLHKRLAPGPP